MLRLTFECLEQRDVCSANIYWGDPVNVDFVSRSGTPAASGLMEEDGLYYTLSNNDNNPLDDNGHGTHVRGDRDVKPGNGAGFDRITLTPTAYYGTGIY